MSVVAVNIALAIGLEGAPGHDAPMRPLAHDDLVRGVDAREVNDVLPWRRDGYIVEEEPHVRRKRE